MASYPVGPPAPARGSPKLVKHALLAEPDSTCLNTPPGGLGGAAPRPHSGRSPSPSGPGRSRLEEILDQGQLDPTPPRRRFGVPTALGVDRGTAGSSSSSATGRRPTGLGCLRRLRQPHSYDDVCPCTATLVCPRRRSAVLVGALLAGPLTSDEAARALAAIGPMRLSSEPKSSSVGGSKTFGMT